MAAILNRGCQALIKITLRVLNKIAPTEDKRTVDAPHVGEIDRSLGKASNGNRHCVS